MTATVETAETAATTAATPLPADQVAADVRRATVRDLLRYVGDQRGLVVLVIALSLVTAAASLLQPALVGTLIERVGASEPVGALPWVLAAVVVVGGVLGGVEQYLVQRTAEGAIRTSRRQLVAHILRLPVAELDGRRTADLVSRVTNDTGVVRAALTQGLVESVAGVFTLVGALVAMALLDPLLLVVAVVVALGAVVAVVAVTQRIERASLGVQRAVGDLTASVDRALRGVRTIRAANATEAETAKVVQDVDRAWSVGLVVAKVTATIAPISSVAMQVCFLAVLGIGGLRVASQDLTVAQLVQFILYLFLLIMPLGQMFGTISAVGEAIGGLTRIREVLDVPTEQDDAALPTPRGPVDDRVAIELDGVSFRHGAPEGGAPLVLDDVTFSVRRGQRVAVVGPSGAGKSTLLDVLVRFYDPVAGTLRVDGRDVRALSRTEVRARVGYVEQDSPALAGTLRDNLTLGAVADDAACREVLAQVNLLDVLDRTDDGLDAEVGEAGVLLSGGERQRLAVARALLAQPAILLLDESTSHLDGLNESRVRELIDRVSAGCTLVVVAHRLSTVVDSDLIVVLDGGRVAATGTHAELLDRSPLYRDLARTQLMDS